MWWRSWPAGALIADELAADALALVRAKCLFALEVHAGQRPDPYHDHAATRYAQRALQPPPRAHRAPPGAAAYANSSLTLIAKPGSSGD